MAKVKVSEWSSTPASNTDIDGINLAEGMLPSDVNNAMREMMSQLKDLQSANPTYYTSNSDAIAIGAGGTGAITATDAKINLGIITSDTGSAKIPTGTTAQEDVSPQAGYFRFNTTTNTFEGYNGTAWGAVGGGATGAGGDEVFIENSKVITSSYSIPSTKNAMSTGSITINSGVTVTVPTGSRWVVL